ncbi:MAG: hypothetical protein LBR10_06520 [Prevotellaceae bacterium]|jgi:hypothetical protein|nr:hypothetical protein [Prevotellaceae bacterium]
MILTSYETKGKAGDGTAPEAMWRSGDIPTKLTACHEETVQHAEEKHAEMDVATPPPDNMRSNPADRILRFREEIEGKNSGNKFMQSAKLLISCILASVYGDKIEIVKENIQEYDTKKLGLKYFLDKLKESLKTGDNIYSLRNREGRLVGLLSSEGPIPVLENPFTPLGLTFNDGTLEDIIKGLEHQHRGILAYWFDTQKNTRSPFYPYIFSTADNGTVYRQIYARVNDEEFFDTPKEAFETPPGDGIGSFPILKHDCEIFNKNILILPIYDESSSPGYYRIKAPTIKLGDQTYAFLPPFSKKAIENTDNEDFSIESLELGRQERNSDKLSTVELRCKIQNGGLTQNVLKVYKKEDMRYFPRFPTLDVYGPAPRYGWIARRNLDNLSHIPSPLATNVKEAISLQDIFFDKIKFKDTGEFYEIYQGPIPLWLTAMYKGDVLGAIPVRVVDKKDTSDWESMPNFIHEKPDAGTLEVAADIGSSRSAIIFRNRSEDDVDSVLVEEKQVSSIAVSSLSADTEADSKFGNLYFIHREQTKIEGKTAFGILTTNIFPTIDNIELYRSGKLILLNSNNIVQANLKKIYSDIKAGKDKKQMKMFAEAMLTMIIDRAIHKRCSTIHLRLCYLTETYSVISEAWRVAIDKCTKFFPTLSDIKLEDMMYLPESLATANSLLKDKTFRAESGAAIIDIGDLSTDIALFQEENRQIRLKKNCSIFFAGRQILLDSIWDYLKFSGAEVESLLKQDNGNDVSDIIRHLKDALQEQKNNPTGSMPDNVRRNFLCIMSDFKDWETLPVELQNLIDICYLTEIVILKKLLNGTASGSGTFNVYLFGGGSSLFGDTDRYEWGKIFNRPCVPHRRTGEADRLARGLLEDIQPLLQFAAKEAKEKAKNFSIENDDDTIQRTNINVSDDELKGAYADFLKEANIFKKTWKVLTSTDTPLHPGRLFNIKTTKKDVWSYGDIENPNIYSIAYGKAIEFARQSGVEDTEIFKVLFAYKIAYESAVEFYKRRAK